MKDINFILFKKIGGLGTFTVPHCDVNLNEERFGENDASIV